MSFRRQRRVLGIPVGRSRSGLSSSLGSLAAAAAPAIAISAAHRSGVIGKGRHLAGQATEAVGKVGALENAVSSHSSTIGKAGALISQARKLGKSGSKSPKLSHLIEQHVDIAVARPVVYNQWTQFEMFPRIMKGVESVQQDGNEKTKWTTKIGPSRRNWVGRITEQVPDERIAWKSEGGAQLHGVVTFHSLDDDLTRVLVEVEYDPKGAIETIGNTLRIQRRRAKRDLRLFKHFAELRGDSTDAWRGRIEKDGGPASRPSSRRNGTPAPAKRAGAANRGNGSRRTGSRGDGSRSASSGGNHRSTRAGRAARSASRQGS